MTGKYEPAALVFLVALHTEHKFPSSMMLYFAEDHHNYSWSLKNTLQSQQNIPNVSKRGIETNKKKN